MSLEIDVLRALLRLARRRTTPTLARLTERVPADESAVRRALFTLARSGLVQRTPAGLRLSLAGLAAAVAFAGEGPGARARRPKVRATNERRRGARPSALPPIGSRLRRRAA